MQVESILIKKETEQNFKKLMEMVQPNDSLLLQANQRPRQKHRRFYGTYKKAAKQGFGIVHASQHPSGESGGY